VSKGRRVPPLTLADRVVLDQAAQQMRARPGLWILRVEHDSWCRYFKTGDDTQCNCEPDQHLVNVGDELEREARL
jgi:hypothetical protein